MVILGSHPLHTSWRPAPSVLTLSGHPIPDEMDFCIPPPERIGEVLYASSTLPVGTRVFSPRGKLAMAAMATAVLWVGVGLVSVDFRSLPVAIVLGALTAAGALAAVFALTKYNAICSYVGRQGAVRLAVHGSPYAEPTTELLEFRKATTLWASVTRKNFRGHYAATSYDFCWYAADRQRVLHLVGRFSSREGTPPGSDPYYFALAAELAWSKYLFASLPVRLEQEGSIRFAVRDREALRVGRGFLEIESAGEVQRIEGTELNRVSMENGQFSYATTDARWYSIKGKFNFDYTKLPNARYFVMVVESLVPRVLSGNSTAG